MKPNHRKRIALIVAVAFEMEKAGKTGDLSAVRARMAEMETQFARLREAMEHHFSRG